MTNLEIGGEFELLDISNNDTEVLGRIDITLRFFHQFGDEDAYVGVECKRVAHGDSTLNQRYVTHGVDRFASAQYGAGHHWGMMLGYVLKLPETELVEGIDHRIRKTYGENRRLKKIDPHAESLSRYSGELLQRKNNHIIHLIHIFVDMTPAATGNSTAS